jgi:hypothetical protein
MGVVVRGRSPEFNGLGLTVTGSKSSSLLKLTMPQRFLSVHDQVANLFRRPARTNAADHRTSRAQAFRVWSEVTSAASA